MTSEADQDKKSHVNHIEAEKNPFTQQSNLDDLSCFQIVFIKIVSIINKH